MAQASGTALHVLHDVLHEAADDLSAAHIAALAAHPEAVRSALAVTAASLSSDVAARARRRGPGGGTTPAGDSATRGEPAGRFLERVRAGPGERLLTSSELAARVGLKTRQSVHDWLRNGKIVGWQGAKRGYVFPAEQIDGRNRPLPGLERVVTQFEDGYAAWVWLTTPRNSLDGEEPLTLLARGESDRVATAATGDRQGDFA